MAIISNISTYLKGKMLKDKRPKQENKNINKNKVGYILVIVAAN